MIPPRNEEPSAPAAVASAEVDTVDEEEVADDGEEQEPTAPPSLESGPRDGPSPPAESGSPSQAATPQPVAQLVQSQQPVLYDDHRARVRQE